jgi:hypothetical protein
VQFGDEPTQSFHAAATERDMFNTTTNLRDEQDRDLTHREEKAVLLWETYNTENVNI